MFRKLIYLVSFLFVLSLALAGGARAADPNLVGWWPLNEGAGDVVVDLSDSGTNGTINNPNGGLGLDGSVWTDDPERGTVISFNGTAEGAYVRAGSIPQMTLTNDFTWAFWAKQYAENTANNDIILGNRKDENAVDFVPRQFIKFTPTKFEWHMNGNGDDNLDYDDIPADVWLHHAVVKAGDQLTYYRNGIEANVGKITQALDFPQPLFFGGDNEGAAGENWSGLMSDARIYDKALTELEIIAAMEGVEWVDAAKDPIPADGAAGVSVKPVISTYASSDVPKDIPDWSWTTRKNILGEVTSTLDVPDLINIKDLNVELDIRKPGNNADLDVYLTSPDGKKVELFSDVGIQSLDNFQNTILDDEASVSIKDGTGHFTGIYRPEGKLSDFDGRDSQGTWKLKITDDWPGGPGTLNWWRIVIENPMTVIWTPPGIGNSQDVYFSENFDDVNGLGDAGLLANLPTDVGAVEVGALALGTTYYWRVDAVDADGVVLSMGDVWSFRTPVGNVEVDQRIASGDDDVEEQLDKAGGMYMDSSDLEFPYEDEGQLDLQRVGLRFVDVVVPADTELIESYIQFEVDNLKGGMEPVNVILDAQRSPDAEPFVAEPYNVSNRTFTETVVPWSVPEWTKQNEKYQTPDISALVQEVINQEGWAPGNAVVFTIQDDPASPSSGVREAESYDGEAAAAPLLRIVGLTESAMNPSPADGAVDVVQETLLRWSPGFTGVARDVYFDTEYPPKKLQTTTGTTYDVGKLVVSTTYYWRIDEYDAEGNKYEGAVWSFTTVIGEATNPYPADQATDVPLDVVLSWTPGATAVSHDGYVGTTDPPPFLGNTTENSFDTMLIGGLEPNTVYYWRLDAIEADGTKHIGDVWSFQTRPPLTAYNPNPPDGAIDVPTDVKLTWEPGAGATLHYVNFGDDFDVVSKAGGAAPVSLPIYDPGPLEHGKTYYWRVDEFSSPKTIRGDVWSFTTVEPAPEPVPEPVPEPEPEPVPEPESEPA